jgi:hypothetical protein
MMTHFRLQQLMVEGGRGSCLMEAAIVEWWWGGWKKSGSLFNQVTETSSLAGKYLDQKPYFDLDGFTRVWRNW